VEFNHEGIVDDIRRLLLDLGMDIKDPNLVDTPQRVARAYREMLRGHYDEFSITSRFPTDGYDEMIVKTGIKAVGICPHHLLPINYDISIGYIPAASPATVVGISKLARLAIHLSARLVLQEQLTIDIAAAIHKELPTKGVGVVVVGLHGCEAFRGVKMSNSLTMTSRMEGAFRNSPATRAEFLGLIKHNGGE